MKYFSTFSGIGGFELGIIKAHENTHLAFHGEKTLCTAGGQETLDSAGTHLPLAERYNRCTCDCPCPEATGYSELDKYASAIYQSHFPNHQPYGDITKINAEELPDFDLLVGGFPCQSFSIAGKRGGVDDARGTLFFEIARIAEAKKPRFLLLENVKGLLSSGHRNTGIFYNSSSKTYSTEPASGSVEVKIGVPAETFFQIQHTLVQLDYMGQSGVANSKNHGVPQNRERVFIVGHLRGTARPEVFPFGENGGERHEVERQQSQVTGTINSSMSKGGNKQDSKAHVLVQLNNPKHSNDRVYGADGISPTLNTMQGGMRQPFVALSNLNDVVSYKDGKESKLDDRALEGEEKLRGKDGGMFGVQGEKKDGHTPQERGLARQQSGELTGDVPQLPLSTAQPDKNMQIRELQSENEETRILREAQPEVREVRQSPDVQEKSTQPNYQIRRLSPVECERLQGFPDGWTEGVSDTQRYKTLGNAVTVNVVADIMGKLT